MNFFKIKVLANDYKSEAPRLPKDKGFSEEF